MRKIIPIYGYEFTMEFEIDGHRFHPIFKDYPSSSGAANDKDYLRATGFLELHDARLLSLFHLARALSFIQQRTCLLGNSIEIESEFEIPQAKEIPDIKADRQSWGRLIQTDLFSKDSRKTALALLLNKLGSEPDNGAFGKLVHKIAISLSGDLGRFFEVRYFLLFSGLEAFCRERIGFQGKNAAEAIYHALKIHGFDLKQEDNDRPKQSALHYAKLRNASFHNGRHIETINGTSYELSDFVFNLHALSSLTVLKEIGFDDGMLNWNCWIDRMP